MVGPPETGIPRNCFLLLSRNNKPSIAVRLSLIVSYLEGSWEGLLYFEVKPKNARLYLFLDVYPHNIHGRNCNTWY